MKNEKLPHHKKEEQRNLPRAEQRTREPERGEIPLRGETGFCSQKKEIRFMSAQASSGCKHFQSLIFLYWFRALGQNSVEQLNKVEHTRTEWESEWDRKSGVRIFFS